MNNSIGVFDSGIGGLSVWKEIRMLLPNESIIYYADSSNCPYGEKSDAEIIALTDKIVELLLRDEVKLIVVACNTATAAAISYLRSKYEVPFVGMEPAVKPAAEKTISGRIGILATPGTLNGNHYINTKTKFTKSIEVFEKAGLGLVELVENLEHESEKAKDLLSRYIDPMLRDKIDKLVLGCTHYPFFMNRLLEIVPKSVGIINPAIPVARQVKRLLEQINMVSVERTPSFKFYSTGEVRLIKDLLKSEIPINAEFISL